MEFVYFTKLMRGRSAGEVAAVARGLGLAGMDLAVRDGHCINPANAVRDLPAAVETWRREGLSVPLLTADVADPASDYVKSLYAVCGEIGIPFVRFTYRTWSAEEHYWDGVDRTRRILEGFEALGAECGGVCTLVHTHCDGIYGSNACGAMHLVRGFDPRFIGVFLDPAHLALDGEYLPMAFDVVRDYLKMVAVKSVRHVRINTPDGSRWQYDWCGLVEGLPDWQLAARVMKSAGFAGPISFHSEYSNAEGDVTALVKLLQADVAYLKALLA